MTFFALLKETALSNNIPWDRGPSAVKSYLLHRHGDRKSAIAILNRLRPQLKDTQKIQVCNKTLILLTVKSPEKQVGIEKHLSTMKSLVDSGALPRSPKPELARVMGVNKRQFVKGSEEAEKKRLGILLAYKGWKRFSQKHPIAGKMIRRGVVTGVILGTLFLVSSLLHLSIGWFSGWWPFGAAKKAVDTALDAVSGAAPGGVDTVDVEMTFTNPRIE
jgi:hypothetical protein